jgi:hypothetical protein
MDSTPFLQYSKNNPKVYQKPQVALATFEKMSIMGISV